MSKMSKDSFIEIIEKSPLKGMTHADIDSLYVIHMLRDYGMNEEIFKSQTDGKRFFLVVSGTFKLVLGNGLTKIMTSGQLIGEIAALTNLERLGTLVCSGEKGQLAVFLRSDLEKVGLVPTSESPTLLSVLFSNTVTYIHELLDNSTETLLNRGEGEHTEFKEGSNNPNILKPVAAFLNSGGGTVLIGVNDESEVVGVDEYSNAAADKFDQDFRNVVREKLGSEALAFIRFSHGNYNNKGLYRIDCSQSDQPVFMRTSRGIAGETFYIRSGSTNQQLGFRAALHYIARRFPNELFTSDVEA